MGECHDLDDFDFFGPEDILYRQVHEDHVHEGEVRTAHCPTLQWRAGLSCDWAAVNPPEHATRKLRHIYVLKFTVRHCRELGIDVQYCPIVDRNDPHYNLAHCLLFLPREVVRDKRKVDECRAKFLKAAVLQPWPI